MPSERAYLDHNATSPLRPEARAAMLEVMALDGNPSSVHAEGRAAKEILERARRQVASLVGAKPEEVVFTSSGTEATNAVIGAFNGTIICGATEHAAVLAPARAQGRPCNELLADSQGIIDLSMFQKAISTISHTDASLASLQVANNETGVVQPLAGFTRLATGAGMKVLTDAVQAAGKIPFSFASSGAQFASISAHKMAGPKGAGALIVRDGEEITALISGGGQERRRRAGTENLIGIAGFGAAAEAAGRGLDNFARLAGWRDEIEAAVATQTPDAVVIARAAVRLPNTSCIALPGVAAETLVMALDLEGVAVSAGSACSSGKVTRSHVLEAMGLPSDLCGSAIRVSLGWNSSKKHVDHFIEAWRTVTDRLSRSREAVSGPLQTDNSQVMRP